MAQVSTGNLPIPNDTGANVLADINENLLALQSTNAGSQAPPVAKANQFYVDTSTTPDTLKIRGNADNAAFITLGNIETNFGMMPKTGGTFTGAITTSAGSQASPSLKISDDNTGFYEIGTNQIGVSCGGSLISSIHQNGITVASNKCLYLNNPNDNASVCLKSQSNLTSSWSLQLPNSDGNAGEVLKTDGNGVTDWVAIQGVPTGSIFPFAGATPPSGYLECNGDHVSAVTYAALAAVCSQTYNKGQTPPAGEFFLPDLRGRFVRGWDHGANVDQTANRTRGSEQGDRNLRHTHSTQHSATTTGGDHAHAIRGIRLNEMVNGVYVTLGSGQSYYASYANNDNVLTPAGTVVKTSGNLSLSTSISLTVNNDPVATGDNESRPKNVALIYIIKS